MRASLAAILFIYSFHVFASDTVVTTPSLPFDDCFKESYISGEECYVNHNKPEYSVSGWQFLEVPINYQNKDLGKTKISYRLSSNFSLDRKTVVYFNGGPGGTSYNTDFNLLDDVNVIYLNQRGAAFSRPETKDLFLNQDYYSSENTARDALEIVKHLGVGQVTAYGMSYGTVPATIFGSLFKEHTRNVILEGVVFDGQSRLWYGSHRIKIVQRYFDRLDPKLKESVLKYNRHPEVFAGWFSALAQQLMYDSNFEQKMTSELRNIFYPNISAEQKEARIIENLKRYSYSQAGDGSDFIYFSPTMFNFIACKELSAKNELSSFYAVFNEKNKLVPYTKNIADTNYCEKLNITKSETYSALNYPIEVPVYYFQGTTDGATTAEYAIWHYKKSAKGRAQLVLAKKEGHAVAIQHLEKRPDYLSEEDKKNPLIVAAIEKQLAIQQEIVKVFKAAINSEALNLTKLNELIDDKKSAWVMTTK